MPAAVILLAAGASARMGQPKPLVPWGGDALVAWECAELRRSTEVDEIVVVLGRYAEAVRRALGETGARTVFNPRWPQGRATSLARGAEALLAQPRRPEFVIVQNVDQPTRHDIIDCLVQALRADGAHAAAQPSFHGRAGHPVVLRGELLPELARVRDETRGLRAVLDRHPPLLVPMDDEPVVRLDMDTPDVLDEGRRLLGV